MATFKDSAGREWKLALDAPTIRVVRLSCDGLNLAATDYSAYDKLAEDPCLLVDVLWILCRDQANGLSDVEFGRALVGDAIEEATAAMLECIADFFPKRRAALARALGAKNRQIREIGMDRALSKINDPALKEKLTAALEARLDEEIANTLTRLNSATNTPASSESPPVV